MDHDFPRMRCPLGDLLDRLVLPHNFSHPGYDALRVGSGKDRDARLMPDANYPLLPRPDIAFAENAAGHFTASLFNFHPPTFLNSDSRNSAASPGSAFSRKTAIAASVSGTISSASRASASLSARWNAISAEACISVSHARVSASSSSASDFAEVTVHRNDASR